MDIYAMEKRLIQKALINNFDFYHTIITKLE